MGLRLAILNLWLRLLEKPTLARMQDPAVLRQRFERVASHVFVKPKDVVETPETWGGVPCTRYGGKSGPATLLHLHGGAYLAGNAKTHGHLTAWLGHEADLPAVLAAYRLAPEHPFPAALDDALAVYTALSQTGPVVLSGDSAGGGLVFALLVALREAGLPDPVACVAFSPWADLTLKADSLRRNAWADVMLPAQRLIEVAQRYLDGADPTDPRASPVLAHFRAAPPPSFIAYGAREILADDAVAMAAALRRDGGSVTVDCHPEAPHAWPIFARRLREADATLACAGAFIRTCLKECQT